MGKGRKRKGEGEGKEGESRASRRFSRCEAERKGRGCTPPRSISRAFRQAARNGAVAVHSPSMVEFERVSRAKGRVGDGGERGREGKSGVRMVVWVACMHVH